MSHASPLRFGWNVDIDFSMDFAFTTRKVVAIWSLLVLHPVVLYILYTKKSIMHPSIRFAYISEQISLIINEILFSILASPYPLFPFAGLHCDGLLSTGMLPKTDLMFVVGFAVVIDVPFFILLIMRMHTVTAEAAGSRLRLTNTVQGIVMALTTTMMVLNWFAFGSFARDSTYYDRLIPEIAAISSRGGTNVIFGVPGDLGVFRNELYLIIATVIICMPLPAFLSAHARFLIANGTIPLSERAQHAQERLSRVFFLQIYGFTVFFVFPLLLIFGLMFMDIRHWPDWSMAILRPLSVMMLSFESTLRSLLFLCMNPSHRTLVARAARDALTVIRDAFRKCTSKRIGARVHSVTPKSSRVSHFRLE